VACTGFLRTVNRWESMDGASIYNGGCARPECVLWYVHVVECTALVSLPCLIACLFVWYRAARFRLPLLEKGTWVRITMLIRGHHYHCSSSVIPPKSFRPPDRLEFLRIGAGTHEPPPSTEPGMLLSSLALPNPYPLARPSSICHTWIEQEQHTDSRPHPLWASQPPRLRVKPIPA
jgi:hypothetical protein